ncbi:hypothetical protein BV22DRAFT_1053576 [Leucogyrophana mollusca]|uniref:Uncharacterized protein n=1 Tax=Leucogyrophana mollusca TaxID=85980 RepID=A0ACB8BZU5_9AGAM|nr:hypothetical protein BV22DRAFT_1053576 [Leucogyrophana mollusca]
MASQEPTLRVLIQQIDYTLAPPGPLDNTSLHRVPIIRIYGASSTGQKACVHVHQVYPYFFVEYKGKLNPDNVNRYIAKLSLSLNHAIALSIKRNPHSPNSQFIRAVLLVKGVHFYGFHSSYAPFLKILVADPAFVNRAATIMQSGTVMRTRFRVYESHLSYLLQFMCDFGLYGCGWINLAEIWQRGQDEPDEGPNLIVSSSSSVKISPYYRQSRLPLEVDVASHQILNRHRLTARNIHHELTIPAPPLPSEPFVLSVRELWEDERRRRAANGLSPTPVLPVDPSENSRGAGGEWVSEARWWDELRKRIEREREADNIVEQIEEQWEKWVMTTFESVEALWEPEQKTWRPARRIDNAANTLQHNGLKEDAIENPFEPIAGSDSWTSQHGAPKSMDIDVDEGMLSTQEMGHLMDREEQEWAKIFGEERIEDQEAFEGPDDDDDPVEEGPPPETEDQSTPPQPYIVEQDDAEVMDPFKDSSQLTTQTNPFDRAWVKLAGRKRSRSSSASSHAPATPTKFRRTSRRQHSDHGSTSPSDHPITLIPTQPLSLVELGQDYQDLTGARSPEHTPVCKEPTCTPDINVYSSSAELELFALDVEEAQPQSRASPSSDPNISGTVFPKASFAVLPSQFSLVAKSTAACLVYTIPPPSVSALLGSAEDYGIPSQIYRNPFYSKKSDAPDHPREYAGLLYHLKGGDGLDTLQDWQNTWESCPNVKGRDILISSYVVGGWEYAGCPPSIREAKRWLRNNPCVYSTKGKMRSQIEGPTPVHPYGLKDTPAVRSETNTREGQDMSLFSLEIFAPSREDRLPDANIDEVAAVFYSLGDDKIPSAANQLGIVAVKNEQLDPRRLRSFPMEIVSDELELLNRIVDIVVDLDPDIVLGWEVQSSSWGYLNARGRSYGIDIGDLISRAPSRNLGGGNDQWGMRTSSTFKVTGRHVFNVWRIMRVEQTLSMYTFENVAFHLLRKRVPRYSSSTLTSWYHSSDPAHTSRTLQYFSDRVSMNLEILKEAETITKNAEFARVFGVDFYSVISRGSQFKVESFMFRIAKPESFVLLSPSKQDVGKQNAAECMPLIMEPLSAFYNGPLVVLDFQSLYPSIMIAYNYCYSTCLGRITDFQGRNKFGVIDLQRPAALLDKLEGHLTVAPNGIVYVKPEVRKGLLGRMLTELLDTRVMVKQAMKSAKGDKVLQRILDARQLGLKYIANVTYGYTGATYSGRMPAVEIADSIVQSGRETLEKAIGVIDNTPRWGARVVYGDTDSLFIYLKGKTKEQAFKIGYDIADTITAMNPAPVKLKFEKVYLPCVLMAKKRYVGFKYEGPDDTIPAFDAKGIETVRRDGVPAQQKMTETCIKILFRTQDLSQVKDYCCRSWSKIMRNKASIQDFIFAKEVKMGTYSEKGPPPPGVTVAARRMMEDENDEPQYGERVPYVIIRSETQTRLVDRAVSPEQLLNNRHMHLDASYYISRVLLPPLERIFNLVGADVRSWFDEMPKAIKVDQQDPLTMSPRKPKKDVPNRFKIDEHFQTSQCLACGALASEGICDDCRLQPQATIPILLNLVRKGERRLLNTQKVCATCAASPDAEPIQCVNTDCSWLFERKKAELKVELLEALQTLVDDFDSDIGEQQTLDWTDDDL